MAVTPTSWCQATGLSSSTSLIRAGDRMRLRAGRILEMQARHPDGRMFAKGEFDTYRGSEQMTCWVLADAFLLHWLKDSNALARQANWNLP